MRSTVAVIDTNQLRKNVQAIKEKIGTASILAIVKANAYGHGMVECSRVLRQEGIEFLGVAFTDEGVKLRWSGDTQPIVVLVPALPVEAATFCKFNLQPVTSSLEFMNALSTEAVKHNVVIQSHLFIETGMNREGIQPEEALFFMNECSRLPNIEMIGVCTHFATSSTDANFVHRQLDLFNKTVAMLNSEGYYFKYIHASNSGGVINHKEAHFNLVRPGTALYGYTPVKNQINKINIKPILTLKTNVLIARRIKAGETVSYDRLYIAEKSTTIATLPIGYGDGFFRSLTGKAECLIHGKRYRIVGAICMDEVVVDIGDDYVQAGDEVILIGEQDGEAIWADEIAERIGTIHYEITTSIAARVPRVFV